MSPQTDSLAPVRWGLVGYGLFGRHHARAIAATPGSRLGAIAVTSAESQQRAASDHPEATIYGDYRQMLEQAEIDVVSVVAPNRLHAEIGLAVLDSGKHLLLEKPMALGAADCDRLLEAARQRGRVLAIGHELRMSSLWGRVRELIDAGVIGTPRHALVELSRFPYRPGSGGWRYDAAQVGSWILEEPIHFFDLACWYLESCGEPLQVDARGNSRQPERPLLTDNFSALIDFPEGAYAVVTQTLAAFGHHQTAKVTGTQGTIWAWWSAADARSERPTFGLRYGLGNDVTEEQIVKPAGELLELADEIRAVADCVRTGSPPPCPGKAGRRSTCLCLAAAESLMLRRAVPIPP